MNLQKHLIFPYLVGRLIEKMILCENLKSFSISKFGHILSIIINKYITKFRVDSPVLIRQKNPTNYTLLNPPRHA